MLQYFLVLFGGFLLFCDDPTDTVYTVGQLNSNNLTIIFLVNSI